MIVVDHDPAVQRGDVLAVTVAVMAVSLMSRASSSIKGGGDGHGVRILATNPEGEN